MTDSMNNIFQPGETCWKTARADRVAFLIDGENYFLRLAEALEQARRCIYIVGWDIDSRIRLRREGDHADESLAEFLDRLARRQQDLEIYLLDWDFAMLFAFERELLPAIRFGWTTHDRIHFQLDDQIPVGASQHQKLVVIDDRVAFCGGFDLGRWRWDSREHRPGDPRRVDAGDSYPPFHDIQLLVTGEVASALGELARQRWRTATDDELPAFDLPEEGIEFADLAWDLEAQEVAILRTLPAFNGQAEVKEIRAFYLAAIDAAERTIYIENQYLTSQAICQALQDSLQQPDGPEIILILPKNCPGWLEQETMGRLRDYRVYHLRQADRHGRLCLYAPHREDLDEGIINVHAKLLIVDDWLLRIGSSNLSNRSMGFDSECDLAIEAGDAKTRDAILHFRHDLLAEHLGCSVEDVEKLWNETGRLCDVIERCSGNTRTLVELPEVEKSVINDLVTETELLDPEQPVRLNQLLEFFDLTNGRNGADEETNLKRQLWLLLGVFVLLLLLAAAWRWTPLSEVVQVDSLIDLGDRIRTSPMAAMLVLGGFVLGCVIMLPVTLMIIATLITFGPVLGVLLALGGSVLGGAAGYGAGRLLGRNLVRRLAGERINGISRQLGRKGWLAVAGIRLLPIAPFTVINLIAGASHIRLPDFLLGTLLGMSPAVLTFAVFEASIEQALRSSDLGGWLLAAVGGIAGLLIIWGTRRWWRRRQPRETVDD